MAGFDGSKVGAVRRARGLSRELGMPHFVFGWNGGWGISAGLHGPADAGYVVCYPSGVAVEVAAL
jgi:hypothetical protein